MEIVADDVVGRVRALKAEEGGLGVYLCGGAGVAGEPAEEVDELVIKMVQGAGMPMFSRER